MNLTIFGATGNIGSLLVQRALDQGDTVYAYVRNAKKLALKHENLIIIEGQLNDEEAMTKAIQEADVVLSTLGPNMKGKARDESTPIADGHKTIINIMEKLGKKRLITLATPTLKASTDEKSIFFSIMRVMAPLAMAHAARDILKIGEVVTSSNLDWTIVRIINPNLKHSGKGYQLAGLNENYKLSVSRANIAKAFYDLAQSGDYIQQMPIVFNR